MATEEFFDIVNENNQPLGFKKSRDEVHVTMKYWHRATHIWIINDKRQVLCQQRSSTKDVNPNKWQSFFGGHLKAGQTYIENAIEELEEELGLRANKDDLVPVHVLKSEKAKHFGQVFILWWSGEVNDLRFKDNEVARIKWITLDEIRARIQENLFCNNIDLEVEKIIRTNNAKTQRGINRRPLKILARLGQKIWYFSLIRSYRKYYQPLIGQGGVNFAGERECKARWDKIREAFTSIGVKNLLDIGCSEGYYVINAARDLNCYALGVEADYSRFCIAQAQINYFDINGTAIMHKEISLESIDNLPYFDAVLVLSVAHHIMYSFGEDYCREFMQHLRGHINKVLIFEMGQSDEVQASWAKLLPDMGKDPHDWIKKFLISCGYHDIRKISVSRSYFGDRDRAIFIARPSPNI